MLIFISSCLMASNSVKAEKKKITIIKIKEFGLVGNFLCKFSFLSLCDVSFSLYLFLFLFSLFCFLFLFIFWAVQMFRSVNVRASFFSSLIFVEENHFEIDFIFYCEGLNKAKAIVPSTFIKWFRTTFSPL
jgi:hypothetical protein